MVLRHHLCKKNKLFFNYVLQDVIAIKIKLSETKSKKNHIWHDYSDNPNLFTKGAGPTPEGSKFKPQIEKKNK